MHICYTRSTGRLRELLVKTHLWRHNCEKVEAGCPASDYRIQGQCPKSQHTALSWSKKRKWNGNNFKIPLEKPFRIRSQVFSRSKFDLIRYLKKNCYIFNEDKTNLLMSIYSGIHPIKALQTKLVFTSQEINDRNLLKIDAWIPDVKPISKGLRPIKKIR